MTSEEAAQSSVAPTRTEHVSTCAAHLRDPLALADSVYSDRAYETLSNDMVTASCQKSREEE